MLPTLAEFYGFSCQHRYPNFDLGETDEETVLVGASCCIEKVTLAVTDVAGNTNEFEATKWDYGSSPLLAWWVWLIIGKPSFFT